MNVSSRSSSLKISTTISQDGVMKTAIQIFCNIHVVSFQYVITFPYQIYFNIFYFVPTQLYTIFMKKFFFQLKNYIHENDVYNVYERMEYADR